MNTLFWACSDNVAGGASGDAGVVAIKDRDIAGVSQKGPFVTGSAVTVQELDGITLKQTGKSFKGTIKSDKGDFAIKDINLQSQYAILEANGYYRDEISVGNGDAPCAHGSFKPQDGEYQLAHAFGIRTCEVPRDREEETHC